MLLIINKLARHGDGLVSNYFQRIWAARYFFTHLALSDLRAKWRRSFFGILWSIIQPLGLTALISVVFSQIFNAEIREYAPYILSGILVWEFVTSTAIGGALAFVQADAYIKQYRHPLAIYTLRTTITNLMVFSCASLSLVLWVLIVMPENFGWTWIAALTIYPIVGLIVWPLATALAYVAVRFRDLQHALGLIFQAMWFVSPIYFEAKLFRSGGLDVLLDYNPIYHLLEIVRAPLLRGQWPTIENYVFCLGTIIAFSLLAWFIGRRSEERVIFYL